MNLPADILALRSWLVWRYEQRPGEPKPRKVPYYAGGGRRMGKQGSPADRAKLVPYAAAADAAARGKFDGVGLAMLPENGLVALDFDNCIDDAGRINSTVERLVIGTYAERSPSGRGVRALMRGALPDRKDRAGGFEVFHGAGFVTITGDVLPECELFGADVAPLSDAVREHYARRFGQPVANDERPGSDQPQSGNAPTLTPAQVRAALANLDPDCGYDEWLRAGMACHHEAEGGAWGLDAWDEWSAGGAKYPGRDALAAKWASFGRDDRQTVVTGRWLLANGGLASADEFDDLPAASTAPPDGVPFPFVPADDAAERPLPEWVVKGVLPRTEMAVVYGASGDGKTFFVLDLVAAIARGEPWHGRKVERGAVAYLVAEGATGFRKRLRAWRHYHEQDLEGLYVHEGAPNLLLPANVRGLIQSLLAIGEPLSVVVVDTLSRATPGANENASEDMGRAIAAAGAIHRATGALVLLVHHVGKDASKGARGWSGLKGALDTEIEVVKLDDGVRMARLTKQKDGADDARFGFRLRTVELGRDKDGDPITSCVVEPCDAPERGPGRPGSGPGGKAQWQIAYDAVRGLLDLADGQVTRSEAIRAVEAVEPFASLDGRVRRSRATRAVDDAIAKGALYCAAGILSLG